MNIPEKLSMGTQELHETELAYNQALDDTIQALQDNK